MHVCHCEEGALRRVEKGVKRKGRGEGATGRREVGKERIGFIPGREGIEIGEVRISSQEFGLWLEGREALLLGLIFYFSTPGFLPATQDALSWGFLLGWDSFF